jgi:hypothetical protein
LEGEQVTTNFLDDIKIRHEKGEKLSEGEIDFLIGVANSSVLLHGSNSRLREALNEIKAIANGVREFNYPCDKIYNIARKGLEGNP